MGRINIILGAGLAGLTAGIKTGYQIYEASDVPGGLCRSYEKDGYRFERGGGHWIFGQGKAIDFIKDFVKLNKYHRKCGVYYNTILEHPIQEGLIREENSEHGTIKYWLRRKFGIEQCNIFFYPFNEKYTCGLYDKCVQDDPNKSPVKGKGYNETFYYPENATSDLIDKMALRCNIKYKHRASGIDLKKKIITFKNGKSAKYDKIISTIPLKDMMALCGIDTPDLLYTSVAVTNIGAELGWKNHDKHWLYVPMKSVPFFRLGFYSNVDRSFTSVKDGVSMCAETAFIGEKPSTYSRHKIANILTAWDMIGEVDTIDECIVKHAYTWMLPGHKREGYIDYLKEHGIVSIGRYGKWKFQGMVDTIMDGLCIEQKLK